MSEVCVIHTIYQFETFTMRIIADGFGWAQICNAFKTCSTVDIDIENTLLDHDIDWHELLIDFWIYVILKPNNFNLK